MDLRTKISQSSSLNLFHKEYLLQFFDQLTDEQKQQLEAVLDEEASLYAKALHKIETLGRRTLKKLQEKGEASNPNEDG